MGLAGSHGKGYGVKHQLKMSSLSCTYHLSHLVALWVTPKWLKTLPGPKMGLAGNHD